MPTVAVTLVTKPGCHLCDTARDVVASVIDEVGAAASPVVVSVDEVSILDHPALYEKYVEEIPVVLINGRVHNIYRVDRARFRNALVEAAA